MKTANIFKHGNSQTIKLPKEFCFSGVEVVVMHFAGGVLLLPQKYNFDTLKGIADEFTGEIACGDDSEPQDRHF